MKPSTKNSEIEDMLKSIFGVDRRQSIINDVCVFCGEHAGNFRDEISRREFSISGLCQNCQDETFGK